MVAHGRRDRRRAVPLTRALISRLGSVLGAGFGLVRPVWRSANLSGVGRWALSVGRFLKSERRRSSFTEAKPRSSMALTKRAWSSSETAMRTLDNLNAAREPFLFWIRHRRGRFDSRSIRGDNPVAEEIEELARLGFQWNGEPRSWPERSRHPPRAERSEVEGPLEFSPHRVSHRGFLASLEMNRRTCNLYD